MQWFGRAECGSADPNAKAALTMETTKKKVIVTLSKNFPAAHSKAGLPTGFSESLAAGKKIHTVRLDKAFLWGKRYKDIMDGKKYLDVREWTGRPYNSEQRQLASYEDIGLQKLTMAYSTTDSQPKAWVDGKAVPVEEIAKNDGLDVSDFTEWFFGRGSYDSNLFEGVIIHFTKFRY